MRGRADLVDYVQHEVWEIKPAAKMFFKNPDRFIRKTNEQLFSYINGKIFNENDGEGIKSQYNPGGPLYGQFDDTVTNKHVTYLCHGDGIVWYEVSEMPEKSPASIPLKDMVPSYVPAQYRVSVEPSSA